MSTITSVRGFALCLAVAASIVPLGCRSADGAAAGEGQASAGGVSGPPKFNVRFQVREPRECAAVKSVPSPSQAAALVQCSKEGLSSQFATIAQDVKVELGSPRPFQMGVDGYNNDIDPKASVVPIRGSLTMYICDQVDNVMNNKGKNCHVTPTTKMTGVCFKTSFGDYRCELGGGQGSVQADGKPGPTAY